jgi:minor extracellular protease Epr
VGVIDTGVNTAHVDLDDNYDAACSYDVVNDESDPNDEHGHGSRVSGIITAADNGSGVVGMAPDASLCVYKVAGATGTANWSDVVAALDRAVADGVHVLNLSLGDDVYPGDSVADAFTGAYGAGLVLVAAAGNQGTCAGTGDNVTWPGRFPETIAVAALDDGDTSACFSGTGAEVELSAPGVDVYSAWTGGAAAFAFYTGTSMAAPHVSGLAALLRGCARTMTNEQVRTILDASAKDLNSPLVPGFPDGRDTWHGFGLIDVRAALAASGCANLPPPATATPTSTAAATRTPTSTPPTSTVVALATSTPRPRQSPPPAVGGISMEPGAALSQTRGEPPPAVRIAGAAAAALAAGVAAGAGVVRLWRQRRGR